MRDHGARGSGNGPGGDGGEQTGGTGRGPAVRMRSPPGRVLHDDGTAFPADRREAPFCGGAAETGGHAGLDPRIVERAVEARGRSVGTDGRARVRPGTTGIGSV